jgi:large subunit ribosomal protein L15
MNLHNLKPAEGSVKNVKRIGRGTGSGHGGTSTRGHKGAGSRSGTTIKRGFEGGQMPLQRRVPKFGFKNISRVEYFGVNIDSLQKLADANKLKDIDIATLIKHKLARKKERVKILGRGELTATLNVKAHAFSASAKAAIEGKGGTTETVK